MALTIAGDEAPVVSAVRVQLASFGRSFAARSLQEELVFVEAALLRAVQRLALGLERTAGLLSMTHDPVCICAGGSPDPSFSASLPGSWGVGPGWPDKPTILPS
ncbi:hypothetical protein F7725_023045, partial [Dissostichus mawsoni]